MGVSVQSSLGTDRTRVNDVHEQGQTAFDAAWIIRRASIIGRGVRENSRAAIRLIRTWMRNAKGAKHVDVLRPLRLFS
jgi:hypothetical protein